jgi:hypothetical protein
MTSVAAGVSDPGSQGIGHAFLAVPTTQTRQTCHIPLETFPSHPSPMSAPNHSLRSTDVDDTTDETGYDQTRERIMSLLKIASG